MYPTEGQRAGTWRATYYGVDDGYGPEDTMANGQRFDPFAFTAASSVWPLGTKLRVVYGNVGVIVEITDRCPACALDLSWGAFGALTDGQHSLGVLDVIVEEVR